ncbi:ribonuclease Z [Candidatus Woesearchaeota archaeon]|nr:ribonuclease Z [Candidatus Woesearchaeota archaeon]
MIKMEFVFLGTSCMVPTKDRNHAGILFSHKTEKILFDCGEGTQRQLKIADISLMKINKIIISHWHGDHVLGLPGLLQSLSAGNYQGKLEIYGPKGTKKKIKNMFKVFESDTFIDVKVHDYDEGKLIENDSLIIKSFKLDHSVETYGFRIEQKDRRRIKTSLVNKLKIPQGPLLGKLQNGKDIGFKGQKVMADDATYVVKGKTVGIINDTVICDSCNKIAKDVDLLISEAAYDSKLEDKAEQYKHMTAQQAGLIASRNYVSKLVLFHYSQRYKDTTVLLEDAKSVFENTVAAHDFMKIKM